MVRAAGLIGASFALAASSASAAANDSSYFVSGNALLRGCQSAGAIHQAQCAGYVSGVFDMSNGFALIFTKRTALLCAPPGADTSQFRDIAIRWLIAHPENRHLPASDLVFMAFLDAYPCTPPPPAQEGR